MCFLKKDLEKYVIPKKIGKANCKTKGNTTQRGLGFHVPLPVYGRSLYGSVFEGLGYAVTATVSSYVRCSCPLQKKLFHSRSLLLTTSSMEMPEL